MVLLLNHVISRENHAMARLAPFAGRAVVLRLAGWPSVLPAAPDLALGVTPVGLWERLDGVPAEALRVELDASNPALLALNTLGALGGQRPRVTVQGDAAFAAEIDWLIANLDWDIEDELAALIGPVPAHQLARWGRTAARALAGLAARGASAMQSGSA
jgi:ubiquinone biosynthesis protein UbiJ